MKIEITLTTPDLSAAINNLADAMRGNILPFETTEKTVSIGNQSVTERKTVSPPPQTTAPAPLEELTGEAQTPAQTAKERKEQLAAEIHALGYEPPASGTVAKFEEALQSAQAAQDTEPEIEVETEITEPEIEVETEITEPEIEVETEITEPEIEVETEITHDSVRAFAGEMVKANPEMGRTKLGAILQKVNAASITVASQKQLEEIVPLLEKAAGKPFA